MLPDELWERAAQYAREQSVTEGRRVSVSELVRLGLEKVLEADNEV
jgi:Arc/MetJ-type ribon-helix-helix transcriptional regulator